MKKQLFLILLILNFANIGFGSDSDNFTHSLALLKRFSENTLLANASFWFGSMKEFSYDSNNQNISLKEEKFKICNMNLLQFSIPLGLVSVNDPYFQYLSFGIWNFKIKEIEKTIDGNKRFRLLFPANYYLKFAYGGVICNDFGFKIYTHFRSDSTSYGSDLQYNFFQMEDTYGGDAFELIKLVLALKIGYRYEYSSIRNLFHYTKNCVSVELKSTSLCPISLGYEYRQINSLHNPSDYPNLPAKPFEEHLFYVNIDLSFFVGMGVLDSLFF